MYSERVRTYDEDLLLFKQLGLSPFDIDHWTDYCVGEIKLYNSIVKITVMGVPAQFWKIEIENKESEQFVAFRTGSGSLCKYWSTIDLFANGMIDIKTVSRGKSKE